MCNRELTIFRKYLNLGKWVPHNLKKINISFFLLLFFFCLIQKVIIVVKNRFITRIQADRLQYRNRNDIKCEKKFFIKNFYLRIAGARTNWYWDGNIFKMQCILHAYHLQVIICLVLWNIRCLEVSGSNNFKTTKYSARKLMYQRVDSFFLWQNT